MTLHPSAHTALRHTGDGPAGQPWTAEQIRALGPVTDIPTAAHIFGLSRATAYDLVKRNKFPIPVLRFGGRYRIPVAAILQALHLPADPETPDGARAGTDLTTTGKARVDQPHQIHSPYPPGQP
ncbi:AlpA family transcriptional regulator [Actinoplanes sp. M2I2]|uniref:helix-turn-helix transcriptional regulator n=1 Tax=Actinoplanes sp. M2I2 TaxID=1734444 RepID=UPI002021CC5F|nr:helix-turn-helix domain-containing protein [Actinoplanes sp. M2I2]